MIKIIDTIHHKCPGGRTQVFHVVNRMPAFKYEREGIWLIGEDSGFFNFYKYNSLYGNFKAFAGREFKIPLKNGEFIEASGQWWSHMKPDYAELLSPIAIQTPENLEKCNVFTGMWVDSELIRHTINPSNNYNKYEKRHKNYGKHII